MRLPKIIKTMIFLLTTHLSQAQSPSATDSPTVRFNEWLDKVFDETVDRYPTWQSYLGIKKDYDKWNDYSEQKLWKELEIQKQYLDYLNTHFDYSLLNEQAKISYQLFKQKLERDIQHFPFRHHNYPINQMFGIHTWIPSFLMNVHRIDNEQDARAYISRVAGTETVISQLIDNLKIREQKNIILPRFIFPYVIEECNNLLKGKPLDASSTPHPLLADFTSKVEALSTISAARKKELIVLLQKQLKTKFKPAYQQLIAYLTYLESRATDEAGVWKFPNGHEYYTLCLEAITTTTFTADEIYEIGLREIARIHAEMRHIMQKVNYKNDNLHDFFQYIKTDPQFYYPQTEEGKKQCLADNQQIIDRIKARLPELFHTLPKAELVVKAVEPFREKTTGEAFYESPAPNGSRPGIYYLNLYDMKQIPKYQLEALAYHEAIPGHHMQISIQQELQGLPKFRTLGADYTAYTEGWGLYSELLPKEYGFYQDPYQDFGRLAMELWRACRLVVDVGIHNKKWTREQAIRFYRDNTPASDEECRKMVDRHIVMPGQATAYKLGQMKILELRSLAQNTLGNQFDIREFHDIVLKNGPLPLHVLKGIIEMWLKEKIKG